MSKVKAGDTVRYLDADLTLKQGSLYKVRKVLTNPYGFGELRVYLEGQPEKDFWREGRFEVVEEEASKYPDTLSFTHHTTSQMYDLVKLPYHNLWGCSLHEDTFEVGVTGATYTAEEIAEHFSEGHWREMSAEAVPRSEVSFAEVDGVSYKLHDGPVEEICEVRVNGVVKERELALPFTFTNVVESFCKATEAEDADYIDIYNYDEEAFIEKACTKERAKELIKEGTWIVKSVGPQKDPEVATEPSKPLTIQVDSEQLVEATERAQRLADAVERVNIALESFQQIVKDFNINVEIV